MCVLVVEHAGHSHRLSPLLSLATPAPGPPLRTAPETAPMHCWRLYRRCMELYRYVLAFRPGQAHHHLREQFCRGLCPCCLHICVR